MKLKHKSDYIDSSSMADIAFLLLIFFLVATTMKKDKGLDIKLPPKQETMVDVPIKDRNLFKILINHQGEYLIENKVRADLTGLSHEIENFILNPLNNPKLAERPDKAVISLKTSRATLYEDFIVVLDLLKGTYYTIYANRVQLSSDEFRKLDPKDPYQNSLIQKAKKGIPMNISIAEPSK